MCSMSALAIHTAQTTVPQPSRTAPSRAPACPSLSRPPSDPPPPSSPSVCMRPRDPSASPPPSPASRMRMRSFAAAAPSSSACSASKGGPGDRVGICARTGSALSPLARPAIPLPVTLRNPAHQPIDASPSPSSGRRRTRRAASAAASSAVTPSAGCATASSSSISAPSAGTSAAGGGAFAAAACAAACSAARRAATFSAPTRNFAACAAFNASSASVTLPAASFSTASSCAKLSRSH